MIKIFYLAAVVTTYTIGAHAQSIRGAFGHVSGGVAGHFSPSIHQDIRARSLLGTDLTLRTAANVGANGFLLFPNQVILGGSAIGYRVTGTTARGEAELSMAAVFFNAGYLLTSTNKVMSFPFIGIGVNAMVLKLTNGTNDQTFSIWNQSVAPGGFKKFGSRGVNVDGGYSVQFLLFPLQDHRANGGIMVGVQIGTLIFAGLEDWHESSSEQPIPSLAQALSFSPYARLTLGLGSFKVTSMRNYFRKQRVYRH